MASTKDHQDRFASARNRMLIENHRPIPVGRPILEAVCPECGQEDCECDNEYDELVDRVPRESLDVMEILAATDPHTFTFLTECEGMTVAAIRPSDPLIKETLPEDVAALADVMTEDAMEYDDRLNPRQRRLRELAQDYGYVITSK